MNAPYCVVVTGFGRCGTSMTMKMLAAGGLPMAAGADPGSGEHQSPAQALAAVRPGTAIKLLDPTTQPSFTVPSIPTRYVWLDRNLTEQARSLAKFTRAVLGHQYSALDRLHLVKSWAADRPEALRMLTGPTHTAEYEAALADPQMFAVRLAAFLGDLDLDVDAMAAVVHDRSPKCAPGLDSELGVLR